MSTNVTPTNPAVQAIVSAAAPQPARLAPARGLLPLAQEDLLHVLVALRASYDPDIATAADKTLEEQEPQPLLRLAGAGETPVSVLSYLAGRKSAGREIH